jgi:cadmium resistance protein CadD (predicted permease)
MKKKNRQLSLAATQSKMLATLLLIFLIKKVELTIVCFLREGAVPMELTVNTIIKYLRWLIANLLIKLKIYLVEPGLAHLGKT